MFSRPQCITLLATTCLLFYQQLTSSVDVVCKDPLRGGQVKGLERKFAIVGGTGAGVGNFLIFFPSAFYFALLTGRDLLIVDDSTIGEICNVLVCGYPKLSEVRAAFPALLSEKSVRTLRGAKVWDMQRHFSGEAPINDIVVRADGFKHMTGWYQGVNQSAECISRVTGCPLDDIACHDRHALQSLIRGPFIPPHSLNDENRMIGVPPNLKHAVFSLPHSHAPRLDAAVHLRCQFMHFERLVGPDDSAWPDAIKERDEWLNSTAAAAGLSLFKIIEAKIVESLPLIRQAARTRRLITAALNIYNRIATYDDEKPTNSSQLVPDRRRQQSLAVSPPHERGEEGEYTGIDDGRVYVYLASDNEVVKEAFAHYLQGHRNISVMRMVNGGNIVHAKNLDYIKHANNDTGIEDLAVDWYALSLANIIFAWRRDASLLSTFAQSAQRISGSIEGGEVGAGSKGLQLITNRHGHVHWKPF